MNRYRTTFPEDDPSIVDGDMNLVGTNYYDSPENLQPGLCQAATNVDFTTQDAVTRGGFVCIPEIGNAPFGQAWTNTSPAAANNWRAVTYGGGLFVAVSSTGAGNRVMTSSDGTNWVSRTSAANVNWTDVCWGNNLFVAVAGSNCMTSPDGKTWTSRTIPAHSWAGVTFGNGLFVAVGGTFIATSPDGITWTDRTSNVPSGFLFSVTYGNGIYVVVSAIGDCATSPDGVTWTLTTPVSPVLPGLNDIVYGAGLFVALGGAGAVFTTPDGVTWTQQTAANSNTWFSLTHGNNGFIAIANTGTSGQIMTSTNGIAWFTREASQVAAWTGVAIGGTVGVAVGSSVSMATGSGVITTFASGKYSDPNSPEQPWTVLVGATSAGFYSFGMTSRNVVYPAGFLITEQSCIVQANNFLFIFGGPDKQPIYWNGAWGTTFIPVPASTLGVGFMDIPMSNSALYYQNRLWVVDGKDVYAASQALDFQNFNDLTDVFNLNVGTSDFIVTSYPFGNNSIVVFKNHSSYLLQNVSGDLTDVTSTEITRQLGIVGINAVTAVGPDIVYISSDRNITSVRLNIQNATQAVTVPLSRNINPLMQRVNWAYASKISVGYWNNLLFVAMPFDNATVCNTVLVYNFITNQWYGEWNFDSSINIAIQGWVVNNYLGQMRLHCITEDGRIFVVNEGHQDVSGTTLSDISMSVTSRAYPMNGENRFNRRMYADLSTNRVNFSITGYVDGVSESSALITNQTYLRSQSFLFPSPVYAMNNSADDYMQAFRKDYAGLPSESIQPQSGFLPESTQDFRIPLIFRRNGRLVWYTVSCTTGIMIVNGLGGEARAGYRSSLIQPG